MKIETLKLKDLTPYEKNAKEHPQKQVEQIKESIKRFGMNDPIAVWGKKNIIVEGHGRVLACKELGIEEVPCIRLDHMTDVERREYTLIHNKTTMNSDFNFGLLEDELKAIEEEDLNIDMSSFDFVLPEEETGEAKDDDFEPEIPEEPQAQYGDIYQLGNHRLMCGDATNWEDVQKLLNGESVDFILTDPPYNVAYSANGTREGIKNDAFESDEECGQKLWLPAFVNYKRIANDCCSFICFMPQGGTHMMMMMMWKEAGWQVKHELIWEKQSIVLNRADFNYQHEPMLYGWNETHKFYAKGQFHTTSVWKFDRPTKSKEHPTMKPLELLGEALLNLSKEGDKVCDLFSGSGSTLMACEQLKRKCFAMELDPKYVDVIIARYEKLTGKKAVKL